MQNLHVIAQLSAERMLNCLAAGLVIALFAWMLLRLIGRRNSGTRFAVWFCALLAIAVSPFLQISPNNATFPMSDGAAITMPRVWALYLFVAWTSIAAVGLARVAAGLWHLRTIRKSCTTLKTADLPAGMARTLNEFQAVRPVRVCVSDQLTVPTAVGFFQPVVVFPAWALRELSEGELNTVLLHELAHLRRRDDWTNLAQKVLRALFFFHPAVWWVESRLSLEREMACDDMVLAQTESPRAYAECLVSLAEKNLLRRGLALAQAAVGRMRQTTQRVLQILDPRQPHAVRVWKPAPWVVGAFSVACLVSSAHAPRLVAFGEVRPEAVAHVTIPSVPVRLSGEAGIAQGARVFSASFTEPVAHPRMNARRLTRHWQPRSSARPTRAVQKTGPDQIATSTASVVQTSAKSTQTAAPQPALLVFMEGQPYGNTGAVLWHISVWQVMLPANPHVMPEIPTKSI